MNSALDGDGQWRVNRRLLALASILLAGLVVSVWPFRLIPAFLHADAILHWTSGVALTFLMAAIIPFRDDALAGITAVIGIIWEPIEWYWFKCIQSDMCTQEELINWMLGEDTILDMTLVAFGAVCALIIIGRYH